MSFPNASQSYEYLFNDLQERPFWSLADRTMRAILVLLK